MKKIFICTCLLSILLGFASASAKADVGTYIDKLKEYNIIFVSSDNGQYQYIGSSDGLSLSFSSNEKKVYQANYMFPLGENQKYATKSADITKILMSHKNININSLVNDLVRNLMDLRDNGDDEAFSNSGVRFEMKLMNNMVHITASDKNSYKHIRVSK